MFYFKFGFWHCNRYYGLLCLFYLIMRFEILFDFTSLKNIIFMKIKKRCKYLYINCFVTCMFWDLARSRCSYDIAPPLPITDSEFMSCQHYSNLFFWWIIGVDIYSFGNCSQEFRAWSTHNFWSKEFQDSQQDCKI